MPMNLVYVSDKLKCLKIMLEEYAGQPALEENTHGLADLLNFVGSLGWEDTFGVKDDTLPPVPADHKVKRLVVFVCIVRNKFLWRGILLQLCSLWLTVVPCAGLKAHGRGVSRIC